MRKKLVNILLINQSAVDLGASLCLLIMGYNKFEEEIRTFSGWKADLYCKLLGTQFLLWALYLPLTWNLVLANLERFLSVVYPIFHKTGITRCHIITSISFVWLVGFVFEFAHNYFTSGYRGGKCIDNSIWPNETTAV